MGASSKRPRAVEPATTPKPFGSVKIPDGKYPPRKRTMKAQARAMADGRLFVIPAPPPRLKGWWSKKVPMGNPDRSADLLGEAEWALDVQRADLIQKETGVRFLSGDFDSFATYRDCLLGETLKVQKKGFGAYLEARKPLPFAWEVKSSGCNCELGASCGPAPKPSKERHVVACELAGLNFTDRQYYRKLRKIRETRGGDWEPAVLHDLLEIARA